MKQSSTRTVAEFLRSERIPKVQTNDWVEEMQTTAKDACKFDRSRQELSFKSGMISEPSRAVALVTIATVATFDMIRNS